MKKKILFTLFAVMFCLFPVINAEAALNPRVKTTPATNIDLAPEDGTTVYAISDENPFGDFVENVKFTARTGSEMITPKSGEGAKKIIVSTAPAFSRVIKQIDENTTTLDTSIKAVDLKGNAGDWFTAYCLNAEAIYPQYSLYNFPVSTSIGTLLQAKYGGTTPMYDKQMGVLAFIATLNNNKLRSAFDSTKNYNRANAATIKFTFGFENGHDDISFTLLDLISPANQSTEFKTPPSADDIALAGAELKKIMGLSDARVIVKSITFPGEGSSTITIDGAKLIETDPSGKNLNNQYVIQFNAKDVLLDKYTVNNAANTDAYNHALWIIEHSYPSMTIEALLAEISTATGKTVTKDDLVNQIKGLYTGETFTDEEVTSLLDNYVYETVQYAIWRATDSFSDGTNRLGDELHLGTLGKENVLNEIYAYLIKQRDEYTNYGRNTYVSDKINIDKTNNDKVTEKGDNYVYGPYKLTYNVINPKPFTYKITSNNADAVSIVDASGNKLENLENNKEFYVQCKKSAKVTDVKFEVTASGTSYSDNEKGKIYYANYENQQNVITGLKYEDVNATNEFELTYNPKTGVPNIAIVFIITLIAFSLGYLALSYNNKSMELN